MEAILTNPPKIKAVRIFCDWCADGVWSDPHTPNSTFEGIRVSDCLWKRIQDWQAWYHKQKPDLDMVDDPEFETEAFVAEGYMIARAVKAELPDWTVHYLDEILLRACLEQDIWQHFHRVEIRSDFH